MKIHLEQMSRLEKLNISIEQTESSTILLSDKELSIVHSASTRRLTLPIAVKPKTARITLHGSWVDIQVSMSSLADTSNDRISVASHPKDQQLDCRVCRKSLLNSINLLESTMELPSDYWHELLECWACHHEDYSKLKGQKGGLVLARKNVLMRGHSYLLLHPDNVGMDGIELQYTGQEVCYIYRKKRRPIAECLGSINASYIKKALGEYPCARCGARRSTAGRTLHILFHLTLDIIKIDTMD